ASSTLTNKYREKKARILTHLAVLDDLDTATEIFTTRDDKRNAAYPKPNGASTKTKKFLRALFEAAVSLVKSTATKVVSAALMIADLFDAVSSYYARSRERIEFLWRYNTEKSDVAHQIAWTAEHPPNETARMQIDDWVGSSVLNGFRVSFNKTKATASSIGNTGAGSRLSLPSQSKNDQQYSLKVNEEGSEDSEPSALKRPSKLTDDQLDKFGFKKVSTGTFRDSFPVRGEQVDEDSQQWIADEYPVSIGDPDQKVDSLLLLRQRLNRFYGMSNY
ncbi:hypothetical protein, partial [Haloarcula sp. H-GB5]